MIKVGYPSIDPDRLEKAIIGEASHTTVKGLSRCKFGTVDFYSGKLYQGDLRLHVNLFTTVNFCFHAIIFPGNT